MRSVHVWVAGVVLVGLGAAWGVVSLIGEEDPADRYRLVTASLGDVEQTVSTDGTVDFVNRADVAFGVDGALAELLVSHGDAVTAGQRLGSLDSAELRAAVDSAEAELAAAEATLEADQQAQQEALDQPAGDDSAGRLGGQQDAVREAQTAAGRAIAAAKRAMAAQGRACAEPNPAPAGDSTPAPEPDAAPAASTSTACADALAAAMAAQDAVAAAQDTLQQRIAELAGTLSSEESKDTPEPQDAPTAATIADDQAAVDRARAELVSAEQALSRATLTAPIAGTVASVEAAPGQEVAEGEAVLVLIGTGAAVVETTVPVERIAAIEVGQTATVTPTGSATAVTGTVSRIGRLVDDSAESPVYPVTVTVEEPPAAMPAGSTAGVAIVIATAEDVLTVPTSAVTRGDVPVVSVLTGAEASPREVQLGAVGPLRTEIQDGLSEGDRVVLADLELPLPSADQENLPGGGEMMLAPKMGPRKGG